MHVESMSGDEVMVLLVSALAAAMGWYRWYRAALVRALVVRNAGRRIFLLAPVACLALLYVALRLWAADDVRNSGTYMLFYMIAGAAWVGLVAGFCGFLGISPRDDVVERQNLSAAFVTAGALTGITLCFAGANVGNGPGWWVVVFSAGLSTAAFFGLWAIVESLTGISETVTVERDRRSGPAAWGFPGWNGHDFGTLRGRRLGLSGGHCP